MKVPQVNKDYFGTTKEADLKKRVIEFVKQNLVGKQFQFSKEKNGIDLTIELTWQGLKNDINEYHPPYIEKLVSFAVLEKILKQAKYLLKERSKTGHYIVYKFFSRVMIDKKVYDVIMIVKKTSKKYLYDHVLLKI